MAADAKTNDHLGGFRRLAVIGSGAQGTVWKAECVEDVHGIVPVGTVVALKIRYEHGENAEAQWLKTESRVAELKAMDNGNVVRYLGCFREKTLDQEKHVVVQEFLEGETLRERLDALNRWNPSRDRLGLDVDEAIGIISQMAAGLGYTAGRGIFHRDVKPGNIFLCTDGTVKLIDFGVARQSDGTITEEGNIRGSWNYLAPDFTDGVFRGDEQSDIFSVGVVLHEIITGRLPYEKTDGDDMAAYFTRWAGKTDESPIRIVIKTRRLLPNIDQIFDLTLTPDRARRYKSFGLLQKALKKVQFVEQRHEGKTFRRLQFIGAGGFGEVFKARWLERNVPVAIKMLTRLDSGERFQTEAAIMKELDDPCFTRFIDFFESEGCAFLVMSFLDGMPGNSLRDAINRSKIEARASGQTQMTGGLPKDLVLSAFERYARGLGRMHGHCPAVIHRDIKPSNLYFLADHPERAAIMDFGIVRVGNGQTANGLAPCTLDYAPPEIVTMSDRGTPGMDVFALGLCLYEALTGQMAYPRIPNGQAGWVQFAERCRTHLAPVFSDPRVAGDPALLRLLHRMTDPDASRRLTDADEVATEIRRIFYRDIEEEQNETDHLDSPTDVTVAIGDDQLMAWFAGWKKANPVDDRRLMELYRKEWLAEHPDLSSPRGVRKIDPGRRSHPLLRFVALLATGIACAVPFAWPQIAKKLPVTPDPTVLPSNMKEVIAEREKLAQERREAELKRQKQLEEFQKQREQAKREQQEKERKLEEDKKRLELDRKRSEFRKEIEPMFSSLPVGTRRSRLGEAEALLQKKIGEQVDVASGKIYTRTSPDATNLFERLANCKVTAVGIVSNACDFGIQVDGQTIDCGQWRLLEFSDGQVTNRSVRAAGYETLTLPMDFDGRTVVFRNGDLTPAAVRVDLPPDWTDAIQCLHAGTNVTSALWLRPRAQPYTCVFRRHGYDDKPRSFAVAVGKPVVLEKLGPWVPSSVEVTGAGLKEDVVCHLDGTPFAGKRMVKPGKHVVTYARRGYVDLAADFKVEVGVVRSLPTPGEIAPWKMAPVQVSIPTLEPDVRCLIDDRPVAGRTHEVVPGSHTYRYTREGYVAQSNITFVVALATPVTLPEPVRWIAERVSVSVPEIKGVEVVLEGKVVSGKLNLTPDKSYQVEFRDGVRRRHQYTSFFVQVNTPMNLPVPEEGKWIPYNPSRPIPKDDRPKPISGSAQGFYKTADEYFELESYSEAFANYYKAFKAGYPLAPEDLKKIEKAFKTEYDLLAGLIDSWQRRSNHADSHRNIEELGRQKSELIRKHRELDAAFR